MTAPVDAWEALGQYLRTRCAAEVVDSVGFDAPVVMIPVEKDGPELPDLAPG